MGFGSGKRGYLVRVVGRVDETTAAFESRGDLRDTPCPTEGSQGSGGGTKPPAPRSDKGVANGHPECVIAKPVGERMVRNRGTAGFCDLARKRGFEAATVADQTQGQVNRLARWWMRAMTRLPNGPRLNVALYSGQARRRNPLRYKRPSPYRNLVDSRETICLAIDTSDGEKSRFLAFSQ